MRRRTDISSLFAIGAGLLLAVMPAAVHSHPAGAEWTTSCRPGEDGFAANCTATRPAGGFTLKLVTADSQVFVSIVHPACETGYRNFDRLDLAALDPAGRRALVEGAFREIEAEIRRTCPTLAPPLAGFGAMPDIAILSPAMDQ